MPNNKIDYSTVSDNRIYTAKKNLAVKSDDIYLPNNNDQRYSINLLPNLGSYSSSSRSNLDINKDLLRFRSPNPNIDYSVNGYEYIFMTKPKLNIDDNISYSSFLSFLSSNHSDILDNLSYERRGGSFIPFVTNLYEKFDLDDVSLNETTEAESWRGYGQKLPTHYTDTINGGNFSITYDELQIPVVTYTHKAWVDYVEKVKFGLMVPAITDIMNKTLDYTSSLYYFYLEPDGETIRLWAKYTGVVPKNIPYSSFGGSKGSPNTVKVSVQYIYSYREILDEEIIEDFNNVTRGTNINSNRSNKNFSGLSKKELDKIKEENEQRKSSYDIPKGLRYSLNEAYNSVYIIQENSKYKLIFL